MMFYIHYYIGKVFKSYRVYYYKKTNGNWLWGIFNWIKDDNKWELSNSGLAMKTTPVYFKDTSLDKNT